MDTATYTCPTCNMTIEGEAVVDDTFIPRVNAHKIAHKIRPILAETYGDTNMVNALSEYLGMRIESFVPRYEDETREREIMLMIWNWYSGGTTAEATAKRIEAAL